MDNKILLEGLIMAYPHLKKHIQRTEALHNIKFYYCGFEWLDIDDMIESMRYIYCLKKLEEDVSEIIERMPEESKKTIGLYCTDNVIGGENQAHFDKMLEHFGVEMLRKGYTNESFAKMFNYDNLLVRCCVIADAKKPKRRGRPQKKIVQIDPSTGEQVAVYDSAQQAAKAVGLKSRNTIYAACKGLINQSKGYKWRYLEISANC